MNYTKRRVWKYRLHNTLIVSTGIILNKHVECKFLYLKTDGELKINAGYAWDGPSGPVIHGKDFMRGSLVHDALYQLMRESLLAPSYRQQADQLLYDMCVEDGMNKIFAWTVYKAVRAGGKKAAQSNVLEAP